MSYKDTLNLPKTTFSMKANLASLEPKILDFWNQIEIYTKLRSERTGKKKFVLHDGPPYANGRIHIGTALNKILKDFVLKFKLLNGFDTPYLPGWDCHGLPVEHQLFKELKQSKDEVEVSEFRKKAKVFALKFVDLQRNDFMRLGVFGDWYNPYLTLSGDYEYWVLNLLGELTKKGYIYRGRKPVNWCASCETALAEAEVEYYDKVSHSIYLLFKAIDTKGILPENCYFLVWTTTPWTLLSNVAVALHPELEYALVTFAGKKILLAKDRIARISEMLGKKLVAETTLTGKNCEGIILVHPFFKRRAAVVLADFVSRDDGSGCVHIAPGHGEEDFSLVKKYGLDIRMPVTTRGVFTHEAEQFRGLHVAEASEAVIRVLKEKNALLHHAEISHSYPHCWRCKQPIIFRATHQWFLNVDHNGLRRILLDAIQKVRWVPGGGIERMRAMLLNRPDWCLSRQRLWGIPIPAVECTACGENILDAGIIDAVAGIFQKEGSDSWFSLDVNTFIPKGFSCPACKKTGFTKTFDILDVWFESGASFQAVVRSNQQLHFPADVYLEGSDQHRGWFQVSLIPSVARYNQPPFHTILTHGFVVDGEGKKMSKSLGNVIAPQEIIEKYGAEILRLWSAWGDYTEDIKISEGIIKQLIDVYRKIRNTLRFILGNIYDFDPAETIPPEELLELDRIMQTKATRVYKDVLADYENFSFHRAAQKIFNFCNIDLSSFYLDILKDRLYTYSPKSYERRSAQSVLYYMLRLLLKLIAPICAFTAEEAFGCFHNLAGKKESVFLHTFAEDTPPAADNALLETIQKIQHLRDEALKEIERKREGSLIGSSLEAAVTIALEGPGYDFFKDRPDLLREILIVSTVIIVRGKFSIEVRKASGTKCPRCWNYRDDIGTDAQYADVCARCATALKERGGL